MRVVVLLLFIAVLSGCLKSDPPKDEMRSEVESAIRAFPADTGPSGTLSSIKVNGDVGIETEFNGAPLTITVPVKMTVQLGAEGDVRVQGNALSLVFTAYCSPERLIVIVSGGQDYDVPDTSAEARNPLGICTGRGSDALLTPYFEFPMIDSSLLTGDLRLDEMTEQSIEKVGKKTYAGTYTVAGDNGTTTLTITATGGHITKMVSQNPNAHLTLTMAYDDRTAIDVPVADHRVPSYVSGSVKRDSNGWTWTGVAVEGGPASEYTLRVYPEATNVGCGTSTEPTASFALADGNDQRKNGWHMAYFDDGDGLLGMGDTIIIQQPSAVAQTFSHVVVVNDDWAGKTASFNCSIPGPTPVLGVMALLGAVALARRR